MAVITTMLLFSRNEQCQWQCCWKVFSSRNISGGEWAGPPSNCRPQTLPPPRPRQHLGSYGTCSQLHQRVLSGMMPEIPILTLSSSPIALDVANKYVVTVSHPTWLTMFWQAQACGALADWLRHQPEYSSLAPKALENFNLASSFMSKVKLRSFALGVSRTKYKIKSFCHRSCMSKQPVHTLQLPGKAKEGGLTPMSRQKPIL